MKAEARWGWMKAEARWAWMKAEAGRRQSRFPLLAYIPVLLVWWLSPTRRGMVVTHPARPHCPEVRQLFGGYLVGSQHDLWCARVVLQTLNPVWRGWGGWGSTHRKGLK